MTVTSWPYRVVDAWNQGWHPVGHDTIEHCYQADYFWDRGLDDRDGQDLLATRGPIRPVLPITDADEQRIRELFGEAGRKTVATLAAALESVFHQLRESAGRLGHANDPYGFAMRTMKAGREGSWESEALVSVMLFGNELNLTPASGKRGRGYRDAASLRAAGPSKRVDRAVHHELTVMLTRWVTGPDRYTEVAETLAGVVSSYADDTAGPAGWAAIADQWLQPGGLARDSFVNCYVLLYDRSQYRDSSLI